MDTQPTQDTPMNVQPENIPVGAVKTTFCCVAGVLVPGLGHALLRKWLRAAVFFVSISTMMLLGMQLHGKIVPPDFADIFSTLKFVAEAGAGLFYWIPWFGGSVGGDPTAYTYDYANLFLYVAGLLNMLVVVDVFDISLGRKQ
jgi:hypothetical protein